jgi:outer membrane protein insertion porin family
MGQFHPYRPAFQPRHVVGGGHPDGTEPQRSLPRAATGKPDCLSGDFTDQIALAPVSGPTGADISVQGNQRIEAEAILRVMETRIGSVYKPEALTRDLRAIYGMGSSTIFVWNRPPPGRARRGFSCQGEAHHPPHQHPRQFLYQRRGHPGQPDHQHRGDPEYFPIYSNIEQIETVYKNKNYHQVKVDYAIRDLDHNQADLDFVIEEGPKIYVTDIVFEGNRDFTDKELKKAVKVSEKGFFYWLTSSGDLDRAQLDQDVARLNAFYSNQGYLNVRVGDPRVDIQPEGIRITFEIDEGSSSRSDASN